LVCAVTARELVVSLIAPQEVVAGFPVEGIVPRRPRS
jgi:hypothetical protein